MTGLRVGVLAYPGCFGSQIYSVPDLLTISAHVAPEAQPPEIVVMSPRRHVLAAGGLRVAVSPLREVDVLVVPGFETDPAPAFTSILSQLAPEIAAIREHRARGAKVVSICVGAFLLAEAGLLTGREATTSWLYAHHLAEAYPDINVVAERTVVIDAGVITTAAFGAMYDLALTLVREHHGPRVARATARVTLLDDTRTRQTPYVDPALLPIGNRDQLSSQVTRHLDRNLDQRYDLNSLAAVAGVSPRTLLRRFTSETQQTPLEYLQRARVRRAGLLLEETDHTVARISHLVGYQDAATFAKLFRRHTGCTPGEYRTAFKRTNMPPPRHAPSELY
ncbi:GlxA family transcriptional regulator [Nocardia alni]|uniref:GlxA family transcriptional regulator n=1 Tax=Nocardia alni TaxID=2815723 RepID=UPI001C248FC9|nr:helix-turn-helix domain-containing protein [Nocardia alni]